MKKNWNGVLFGRDAGGGVGPGSPSGHFDAESCRSDNKRATAARYFEMLLFEVAEGQPPLGDVLADHELVQVGNQGLGGRDRGEEGFLRRALRGWNRLGLWLRVGLGDSMGGAAAADADDRVDAAFIQRDVQVEAEIAADRGLIGHGDTGVGGVSGPPTLVVEYAVRRCQLAILSFTPARGLLRHTVGKPRSRCIGGLSMDLRWRKDLVFGHLVSETPLYFTININAIINSKISLNSPHD